MAIDSIFGVVADPERSGGAIFVPKPNFAVYHRFVHNNADLWPFSNSAERGARSSILFDLEIGGNRGRCQFCIAKHHFPATGLILSSPVQFSCAPPPAAWLD